mmetsp:Transcript_4527/g.10911  ORF Transcript_4527/g.10911 Transcript_4527/m.10911 type:complete len:207 (+) Transcript_4527:1329-1949(+)
MCCVVLLHGRPGFPAPDSPCAGSLSEALRIAGVPALFPPRGRHVLPQPRIPPCHTRGRALGHQLLLRARVFQPGPQVDHRLHRWVDAGHPLGCHRPPPPARAQAGSQRNPTRPRELPTGVGDVSVGIDARSAADPRAPGKRAGVGGRDARDGGATCWVPPGDNAGGDSNLPSQQHGITPRPHPRRNAEHGCLGHQLGPTLQPGCGA